MTKGVCFDPVNVALELVLDLFFLPNPSLGADLPPINSMTKLSLWKWVESSAVSPPIFLP